MLPPRETYFFRIRQILSNKQYGVDKGKRIPSHQSIRICYYVKAARSRFPTFEYKMIAGNVKNKSFTFYQNISRNKRDYPEQESNPVTVYKSFFIWVFFFAFSNVRVGVYRSHSIFIVTYLWISACFVLTTGNNFVDLCTTFAVGTLYTRRLKISRSYTSSYFLFSTWRSRKRYE